MRHLFASSLTWLGRHAMSFFKNCKQQFSYTLIAVGVLCINIFLDNSASVAENWSVGLRGIRNADYMGEG